MTSNEPQGSYLVIRGTISQFWDNKFQGLITIAVEELCETANALLAPVRLGVARPTAPFALSSSANSDAASIEELFSAEPVAPRLLNGAGGAAGSGRDNRDAIQHTF